MHGHEIAKLIGKVERAGFTLVPLDLHYKGGRIKLEVGLAKGKKQYDKRDADRAQSVNPVATNISNLHITKSNSTEQ